MLLQLHNLGVGKQDNMRQPLLPSHKSRSTPTVSMSSPTDGRLYYLSPTQVQYTSYLRPARASKLLVDSVVQPLVNSLQQRSGTSQ